MLKEYIKYHNDGTIWAKGQVQDGIMTGYWEWYRKDGTKMRSGYFDDGQQVGEWITYSEKGEIVKVTDFDLKKRAARAEAKKSK
jgi:antitoxin component YwqK of YwqJK toxin-antitoxin module